jgi:hypothetical protein
MAEPSPVTTFLIRHPSTWRFLTFSSGLTLSDPETPNGLGEPHAWQFGLRGTMLNCHSGYGFEPYTNRSGFNYVHDPDKYPDRSNKELKWQFTRSGRIQHMSSGLVLVAAVKGQEYEIKAENWVHQNMAQQWQIIPFGNPVKSICGRIPFTKFVIRHPSTCRFLTATPQSGTSVRLSDPETPDDLDDSHVWYLGQGGVIKHDKSNHFLTQVSSRDGKEIKARALPEYGATFRFTRSGRIQPSAGGGRVLAAAVKHDCYEIRLENWVDGNLAQQWQIIPLPE